MTEKKVSFIIPVLNEERYIKQCIDHIIKEMCDDDEIIVIDNGSTDNTLKIIGQYEQIKVLKYPEVSISSLRNRGARKAKGDYFAFIDADCVLCGGWRDSVGLVLGNCEISATGSLCNVPHFAKWIEKAWWSQKIEKPRRANYINSGNFVVKRDAFRKIGGFNEKLITDEDSEIGLRLRNSGYHLMEAPQVRAIHLGNPKTIKEFYEKEKWHANNMLSFLAHNKIDKPLIMTVIFMLTCLGSISLLPFIHFKPFFIFAIILLLLFVPLFTTICRVLLFKNYCYFFHLIILYFFYFSARAYTLTKIIIKKDNKMA